MTPFQALILGLVQGLTEFLPISSSGHLVLVPAILGWQLPLEEAFIFDVLVQMGTLLALMIFFWSDLWPIGRDMLRSLIAPGEASRNARLGWLLVLATLPAVVFGRLFHEEVQRAFASLTTTGLFLIGTAVMLTIAELVGKRSKEMEEMTAGRALVIGVFQILALFPGLSRSGATISGGMVLNFERRVAARFAFLMAVPIMIGAGALTSIEMSALEGVHAFGASLAVGFLAAAAAGYFAIRWFLAYLSDRNLFPFAIYCLAAGFAAVFFAS